METVLVSLDTTESMVFVPNVLSMLTSIHTLKHADAISGMI